MHGAEQMDRMRSMLDWAFTRLDNVQNLWGRFGLFFIGTIALFGVPWIPMFLFRTHLRTPAGFWTLVALVLAYAILVCIPMHRMASWAGTIKPEAATEPVDLTEMRARLLSVNELDIPFRIVPGKNGKLVAEWRIADARWAGPMQAGGLKMVHKITLVLDETRKRVYARDREWKCSFRAGIGRLSIFGSFFIGIAYFSYERAAEYGLLFRNGKLVFGSAYNYRFQLIEMKKPLVDVITDSGWTFRPVVVFARLFN